MGTIAYWDCPTGIAGDMCLGALVNAGVPLEYLQDIVQKLGLEGQVKLWTETVKRGGIEALKMHVEILEVPKSNSQLESQSELRSEPQLEDKPKPIEPPRKVAKAIAAERNPDKETIAIASLSVFELNEPPEPQVANVANVPNVANVKSNASDQPVEPKHSHSHDHGHNAHGHNHEHPSSSHTPSHQTHATHRHLPEIERLIRSAKLPKQVEVWSLATFRELAIAEGLVHGIPPEQVHFHEVGAIDAIVDIVCTCAGLGYLGVEQIYCSPLPAGGGYVHCDHGIMPVPAPATLKLWETHAVTTFDNGIRKELVTPTGAAIAVTLSDNLGNIPLMTLKKVGLGAGSLDLEIPNILRLWLGSSKKKV